MNDFEVHAIGDAKRIALLEHENLWLREIISKAQLTLADYLSDQSISRDDTINQLLEILDNKILVERLRS